MSDHLYAELGRRESQIMDIAYQKGEATAEVIRQALPDPPSNSSVRSMLRLLEKKGHLMHRKEGRSYVYSPTVSPERASRSALRYITNTFFGNSAPDAAAALISMSRSELSEEDLDELARLIEDARKEDK